MAKNILIKSGLMSGQPFWSMSQRLSGDDIAWVYLFLIDPHYSSYTKTGLYKGNYKPDEHWKSTAKREKSSRER